MKLVCTSLALFLALNIHSQHLNLMKTFSGQNGIKASQIVVNSYDEIYVAGDFKGVADFDPSFATYTLNSGSTQQVYLAKFDTWGKLLWVKQFDASGNDAICVSLDVNKSGEVALMYDGVWYGDHVSCAIVKVSAGGASLWKWEKFANTHIWARQVRFDLNEDLLFTWKDDSGIFFGKMSATGAPIFVNAVAGVDVNSIVADVDGNVYYLSTLSTNTDLQVGAIYKYDPAGNFIWHAEFGNQTLRPAAMVVNNGRLVVAGTFSGVADFAPGPANTNTLIGDDDLFIMTVGLDGSPGQAVQLGGQGSATVVSMRSEASGHLLLAGRFSGKFEPDPVQGPWYTLTAASSGNSGFAAIYTSSLTLAFAKQLESLTTLDATLDELGFMYACGTYSGTFDPDFPGNTVFTGNGKNAAFFVRYGACQVPAPSISLGNGWDQFCSNDTVSVEVQGAPDVTYYSDSLYKIQVGSGMNYTTIASGPAEKSIYVLANNFCGTTLLPIVLRYSVGDCVAGLQERMKDLWGLYPNPAGDELFLKGERVKQGSLLLYDLSGRLMLDAQLKDTQTVDLHFLTAGVYLVVIRGEGREWKTTLVKE
jgi:hypothetical protein